jgi:hypothetical protein
MFLSIHESGKCSGGLYPLHRPAAHPDELGHPVNPVTEHELLSDAILDVCTDPWSPEPVPSALARFSPALTRSTIMARSNSAKTPSIWNNARPAGVLVSTDC